MRRFVLSIVLLASLIPASAGQGGEAPRLPRISLVLPAGVASETLQISYFMSGPFGGYGGFVKTEKNRPTYDIDASVDGRQATGVKVLAYLPGCEIVTLDIPVPGTTLERRLPCKPLGSISLHGQIFPISVTQEQPTEIEVTYLAFWAHTFFGIADGPVTTIRLGPVVPDEDGQFEVKLPDFYKQTNTVDSDSGFQFVLRQPTGGNIIAFLKPAEAGTNFYGLKVRPSYEPVVRFMAERQ